MNEKGTFQKWLRHGMESGVTYKMAQGHITFVPFFLGLLSSPKACLEINLALLNIQDDYVHEEES